MAESNASRSLHETVLDVDAERLAQIYAEAALNAAGDLPAQGTLVDELEAIVHDVLRRTPRIQEVFGSRLISEDDKVEILDRAFSGKIGPITLNVLKVMARHNRLSILRELARVARKLWQRRYGQTPVHLETANPLDESLQREILDSFSSVIGVRPLVTAQVNPDLIGGFVLRVGDRVFDGSVRSQLEHTRHAMINGAVEAIQRRPQLFSSSG